MTYRDAPHPPPLIMAFRGWLVACDAATGAKRWHQQLSAEPTRLFQVDGVVFVAQGPQLSSFDIATGAALGGLQLGFTVSAAIAKDGRFYLAGERDVVCLTIENVILWTARVEGWRTARIFGEDPVPQLVCYDAQGQKLWRLDVAGIGQPGLMLGDLIAQPDLVGGD